VQTLSNSTIAAVWTSCHDLGPRHLRNVPGYIARGWGPGGRPAPGLGLCVLTNFFETVVDADLSEAESYEIGHALPAEGVQRLSELLDHPCIDRRPETSQE